MSKFDSPCNLSPVPKLPAKSSQVPHLPLILRDPTMFQPQIKFARDSRRRHRSGLTLIELLVAVSILVIIAAILVPQLRLASADRNIREASRTVASLFAQASQRGINDGQAGVVIERNPNILDAGTSVAYAGTSAFILRKVPRYIGESEDDVAEVARDTAIDITAADKSSDFNNTDIFITLPLEQEDLGIIRVGDQISFAAQPSIRFNIANIAVQNDPVDGERKLRLELSFIVDFLDFDETFPDPEVTEDTGGGAGKKQKIIGAFTVYRQPRKLVSSRIDMPSGYLVDLRLSGEVNTTTGIAQFAQDDRDPASVISPTAPPTSVVYLFNGRGSIDRFFYTSLDPNTGNYVRSFSIPSQPAYLMVREYSTDTAGEDINNVLASERTMWVTVDPVTGASNVVSGVGIDRSTFGSTQDALRAARTLSSQGQQAAQ